MSDPVVAKKGPYIVELDVGTYYWCSCGKSQKQPFCDGSHKGSEFSPLKFDVTKKQSYAVCGCKHSGSKPFCDGGHNKL